MFLPWSSGFLWIAFEQIASRPHCDNCFRQNLTTSCNITRPSVCRIRNRSIWWAFVIPGTTQPCMVHVQWTCSGDFASRSVNEDSKTLDMSWQPHHFEIVHLLLDLQNRSSIIVISLPSVTKSETYMYIPNPSSLFQLSREHDFHVVPCQYWNILHIRDDDDVHLHPIERTSIPRSTENAHVPFVLDEIETSKSECPVSSARKHNFNLARLSYQSLLIAYILAYY